MDGRAGRNAELVAAWDSANSAPSKAFVNEAAARIVDRSLALSALLTDALATLECEIVAEHPAGDHWIVVGRVDDLRIPPIEDPLIFFAGALGAGVGSYV
jgi:flavin reductase (DIM6/NTAB) family NADH-FMN oxidoreductase RutF